MSVLCYHEANKPSYERLVNETLTSQSEKCGHDVTPDTHTLCGISKIPFHFAKIKVDQKACKLFDKSSTHPILIVFTAKFWLKIKIQDLKSFCRSLV